MLCEITIIAYLLACIVFLVYTMRDADVPKTGANIAALVASSLVWPIPLALYLISGRK
jgi:hypothetical protein